MDVDERVYKYIQKDVTRYTKAFYHLSETSPLLQYSLTYDF
jgi:hypothetical protein